MNAADLARVRFLVRADAWAAWETLNPPADALDLAYAEYGDLRLVAAYVLETVCSDARTKAADLTAQTKRIKVGPIELEKAVGNSTKLAAQADDWCARAAALRAETASATRQTSVRRASLVVLPEIGS